MDPQHPHEADHNDLEELFIRSRHWWALHGTKLLIVVTLLAVAFTAKRLIDARAQAAHQLAWQDLAFATSPDSYLNVAQTHDNPTIRALAHLRAADLMLFSAQDLDTNSDPDTNPENQQQNLDEAVIRYNRVTENNDNPTLFRINAHLGLAAVAETRGNWTEAQAQYNSTIQLAGPGYESLNTYATTRLELLPRLKMPVVFAPDPPPDTPPDPPTVDAQTETPTPPTPAAQVDQP